MRPIERAAIVWERSNAEPLEYAIWPERPVNVGREMTNTIVIDSPFVSKTHALLQYQNGQYVLEDLGSANGTKVNGHPVQTVALRPGDVIEFGDQRLVFVERAAGETAVRAGLSKGTKLALVAAATATVMIVLLGILVTSASPRRSPASTDSDKTEQVAGVAGPLPEPATRSGLIEEVLARAAKTGVRPADALYDEAQVQFRSGRLRETRELLGAVVKIDPSHDLAPNRLKAAEALLTEAITRYGAEAQTAYARLRYDDAIAAWEQVLQLAEPGDPRYEAAAKGINSAKTMIARQP